MQHEPFAQLTTQYMKPPQEQQSLVGTCCSKFPSLLTGTKLEITGSTKQTSTRNVKITHAVIGITKLVIKYFLEKMVSIANQKVSMKVILGLSDQFIQMGLSGFNTEQNQNN
jgi:hypothetical protein